MPTRVSKQNQLNILSASRLATPWLVHGFSTRTGGFSRTYGGRSLNLGFTKEDNKAAVERNREAFLLQLRAVSSRNKLPRKTPTQKLWPLITLRQIHSDIVHCVNTLPESPLAGDGLVTATPGLLLGIQTADCLPVIVVDAKQRAVGVFHAGWRGTLRRIAEKGVGEMRRWFNSRPQDLTAAIGPGIHGCCYEVGEEVREKFHAQFAYAAKLFREVEEVDPVREKYPMLFLTARAPGHSILPKKIFLDLAEANRQQLLAAGVPAKGIEVFSQCTNCHPELLFSYRAEKGKTGRMMAAVGIRD